METTGHSHPFPLSFALPEGFSEIDLNEDAADRAQRLNQQLERTVPMLTGWQQAHLLLANQYMIGQMLRQGIIYAATFVGRSEQDSTAVSTAQFTVMIRPDTHVTSRSLHTIRDSLRNERADCVTEFHDFPVGRCLVVMEDDRFHVPVNPIGQTNENSQHVRQVQVIFPLTDRNELAFFALSTDCLRD